MTNNKMAANACLPRLFHSHSDKKLGFGKPFHLMGIGKIH